MLVSARPVPFSPVCERTVREHGPPECPERSDSGGGAVRALAGVSAAGREVPLSRHRLPVARCSSHAVNVGARGPSGHKAKKGSRQDCRLTRPLVDVVLEHLHSVSVLLEDVD